MNISEIRLANEAKQLREQLRLDNETPIGDIEQLVDDAGYQITSESFGNQFSAALIYQGNNQFLIVLNEDQMWNDRFKRFTIAHELGHITLLEHQAEMERNGGKLQTVAEFRSNKPIEREADLFAVYFLAPTGLFNRVTERVDFNKSSLKDTADILNISLMSTAYRFVSLTDLYCSLIITDNFTSRVRFEFKSKALKNLVFLEPLRGTLVPPNSITNDVFKGAASDPEDVNLSFSTWYPDVKKNIGCIESVFQLGYNNTTVTMLSLVDDPEDIS